ncbi:MAG: aspartate/tyrosine/aromatic aminotransferase [Aeromonadales bacterium]|nr:aspartate/tyrosine/aromatic aminotransferase [Aeromonadales bacterium]
MFFDRIEAAPADPILGLNDAYNNDPNKDKVNLGVGVYQNNEGQTVILNSVKAAEKILLETENTKSYLPITGLPLYGRLARELIFGEGSEFVDGGRAVSCHCPGGTGALRIGADLLHQQNIATTIWISDPTWANHYQIATSAGLKFERYPYYDRANHNLAFDRMLETLSQAKEGDVVLMHACCHNPTGIDPTQEQWETIAKFLAEKKLIPFIDFAYQGFGNGIEEDAQGVRTIAKYNKEMLIASSFSKNFGLYNERVGVLTVVSADAETAAKVLSQVKIAVRSAISNPPAHGEKVVTTILSDKNLRAQWEEELKSMRDRIQTMRSLLSEKLKAAGACNFDFINEQNGMFSFSGLDKDQVAALRKDFGVYIVGSGRICVAGINTNNIDYVVNAIASVIKK